MPSSGADNVVDMLKQYARASMEVHYWQILVRYHDEHSPSSGLAAQFTRELEEHRAEAQMMYERLSDIISDEAAADALDVLDDEMVDIAETQARDAIESGAVNGLNSARGAVYPQAVYASDPVRALQEKIERSFGVTIDRGNSSGPDGPDDGAPKGKLLKFGKRLFSALPVVGAGMALLEVGSSLGAFRDMQAFASELEDRGIASPAEIEELRELANQFIAAAGGELAAGLSPIPGVSEAGEIALNVIKNRLREAYDVLRERLENMEPVENIDQSSYEAVAREISEETGEEFSADDIEEMYDDSDDDLDELRDRVDAYRERFRDHNATIQQYQQMLEELDSTIDGLDNLEVGRVMVSNDVTELPESGFSPTKIAVRGNGDSGPVVT